ncbi:phosphoenolpyruvate carboxykinase [ATP] 2 [Capsulimonas corticalis]|uniref:Phosphoenolpyruvate carboxykinase (ATP) n=1 Tax=Capsulimonas corticalis TaxID=2219043 RepID=A0A402CZV0_9BACT|nr:phosphoenolpyruvate carboxykinase (ATP) [Capsulimonas corticalis]BDI33848.1 phosphoenolpyruvate carboxykinase [ATP] 2 [Capsulimonas corticalis]
MPTEHSVRFFAALERHAHRLHRSLSVPLLFEAAIHRGEAQVSETGALRAVTGKYTGRSPQDKFLVDNAATHDLVDWGKVNQPLAPEDFENLRARMEEFAAGKELFVFDGFAGASPEYRLPIRVVTQYAWHSLFAHQLFVRPTPSQLENFVPEFLLVDLPGFHADPVRDHTRSETVITLNFESRIGLICGTEYAGEIKKSIFTVLNFLLPQQDVFPMHCSANTGPDGGVSLFFGLSGTGKTTLSADPDRKLIGDDEHGWSGAGVFNFEGGCYAKCIRLSAEGEPQIWDAIKFGSVLENVVLDPETRAADYDDVSLTENTRAAYPVDFIPSAVIPGVGGHPDTIFFLTADAFGVLPPISRLTRDQAMYHFMSGYTSKLAGTERGVTEPEPNFSSCFGAPFWPLPPAHYAQMLGNRLDTHNAVCYLVNTGWTGGPYGVGSRMKLTYTRAMIHAALSGALRDAQTVIDPVFGLQIPTHIDGVPDEILQPSQTWSSKSEYDTAAQKLAQRFAENFQKFGEVSAEIAGAGPRIS